MDEGFPFPFRDAWIGISMAWTALMPALVARAEAMRPRAARRELCWASERTTKTARAEKTRPWVRPEVCRNSNKISKVEVKYYRVLVDPLEISSHSRLQFGLRAGAAKKRRSPELTSGVPATADFIERDIANKQQHLDTGEQKVKELQYYCKVRYRTVLMFIAYCRRLDLY